MRPSEGPMAAIIASILRSYNKLALYFSMLALIVTSGILSYSVVSRYFFHAPTDWQDEVSVILLIGVIFLASAYVQSLRGHISIEILDNILPERLNTIRLFLIDVVSFLFCAFFSWKSWTLFYEAWSEGQTTDSVIASPLWIPYSLMATGMSFLTLQIFLQLIRHKYHE
jgi:TRAP-type C4-dicarboxylate transport system permease small subunit